MDDDWLHHKGDFLKKSQREKEFCHFWMNEDQTDIIEHSSPIWKHTAARTVFESCFDLLEKCQVQQRDQACFAFHKVRSYKLQGP